MEGEERTHFDERSTFHVLHTRPLIPIVGGMYPKKLGRYHLAKKSIYVRMVS